MYHKIKFKIKKNNSVPSLEENLCDIGLHNNFFDMTLLIFKNFITWDLTDIKALGLEM